MQDNNYPVNYKVRQAPSKSLVYITNENNISEFPNIQKQLVPYKSQLIKRREAANGTIEWYSLNWPRRKKLFENRKILIRQTANRIIAAYDNDGWYCLKSGLIVQLPDNSDLHYFYLLALLNSKLFDFLYHDLVNEDNRIFPEVKPIQLFKLPIKIADKVEQEPIVNLVEQIYSAKSNNLLTDNFETQIDQLVYQLYDLTAEEIAIIENGVK